MTQTLLFVVSELSLLCFALRLLNRLQMNTRQALNLEQQ